MGKSKEHPKAVANLQALQDLAKKLHEEKDAKSAATGSEAVPGADDPPPAVPVKRRKSRKSPEEGPAEPNAKEAVAEPSKKSRKADKEDAKISKGKSSDNLQLSEKTMFDAENFNPTALLYAWVGKTLGSSRTFTRCRMLKLHPSSWRCADRLPMERSTGRSTSYRSSTRTWWMDRASLMIKTLRIAAIRRGNLVNSLRRARPMMIRNGS